MFAREPDRVSLSLTPSLNGGMMGIKDFSSSSLAYYGPLAGGNLRFTSSSTKIDYFVDELQSMQTLPSLELNEVLTEAAKKELPNFRGKPT